MLRHMVGSTPKSRALGAALRRARDEAGLSARQLAATIGVAHTTINRWEAGDRGPRPTDVATVLAALGASSQLREELIELSQESEGRHWVEGGIPEQRRQLTALLDFERDASQIVDVASLLMPGLLQTSGYARAIMIAAEVPKDEIDTRVAIRLGRRDVIMRREPATLLTFIEEGVLRRDIGGPAVMADQLRALNEASHWPNVDIRVVPASAGWHPALDGPFVLLEFADRAPVVHVENRRSALFFHEPLDVVTYQHAVDRLLEVALSPADARERIAEAIEELETAP